MHDPVGVAGGDQLGQLAEQSLCATVMPDLINPAPVSIPHTVRRRVCAIRPTTSPTKVWNVGAVKRLFNFGRAPSSSSLTIGGVAGGSATVLGAGSCPGSGTRRRRVSPA